MGFGNERSRGRSARGPEISLLSMAFNMPTPQDLKREARRRASRDDSRSREATPRAPCWRHRGQGNDAASRSHPAVPRDGTRTRPVDRKLSKPCTWNDESYSSEEGQGSGTTELYTRNPSPESANTSRARADAKLNRAPRKPAVKSSKAASTVHHHTPSKQTLRLQKKPPKSTNSSASILPSTSLPEKPYGYVARPTATAAPARAAFSAPPLQTSYLAMPFSQPPDVAFIRPSYTVPGPQYRPPCFLPPSSYASGARQASNPHDIRNTYAVAPPAEAQGPTRHFSLELKRIQGQMDQVSTKLSQNPQDGGLRHKLQDLQHQLNSTLNTATAQTGLSGPSRSSERASPSSPRKNKEEMRPPNSFVEKCNDSGDTPDKDSGIEGAKMVREVTSKPACSVQFREESPGRAVRHHLCSACGDIRSSKFHQKHPLIAGQKPLLNYCGPCKEDRIEHGDMLERHHFCFGCGVVRSKVFQRKHAATVESHLLPNYCARCRKDVKDTESIVEASVVSSAVLPQPVGDPHGNLEASLLAGRGKEDDATLSSKPATRESIASEEASLRERLRARRPFGVASTEHLHITPIPHAVGPASVEQISPFCPSRRLGSAQRRVERSSKTDGEDFVSPTSAASENFVYQKPFVEDVGAKSILTEIPAGEKKIASPVGSEGKTPSSSSASSGRKTGHKSCLKGASAVSLPGPRSPPVIGSTEDCSRALGGTPDAGSSSSKTVKFRSFVRVRHSHTRHSSNASSQVEFRDAEIDPGDAPTSPRAGVPCDSSPLVGKAWSESTSQEPDEARHEEYRDFTARPSSGFDKGCHADSPTRFPRGAFGTGFGSPGHHREVCEAGPRRGVYLSPYDESSPIDEGFPRDLSGHLDNLTGRAASYETSSSFRSSRGAFSGDFHFPMDSFGAGGGSEGVSAFPAFSSPNAANPELAGDDRKEYSPHRRSYREQSECSTNSRAETPSFGYSSRFRGYDPSGRPNHTTRSKEPPCSDRREESSSSSNPYYKPSLFASAQELFSRSRQSPASEERPSPDLQTPNCGRVPEPIIEEPDSPAASPVRMKLLGFHVPPMSELSVGESTVCGGPPTRSPSCRRPSQGPAETVVLNRH